MVTSVPGAELPKSLQSMIEDAKRAVAHWDPREDEGDPILQAGRDWTLRLSRGEFEDDLYWECIAEDREEVGDWKGALSAYRRIVDLHDLNGTGYSKAYSAMGAVQRLLGDDQAAF